MRSMYDMYGDIITCIAPASLTKSEVQWRSEKCVFNRHKTFNQCWFNVGPES